MHDRFTTSELQSIHRIWKFVNHLERHAVTHAELAVHLIRVLVEADTASVAAHCTSLLPEPSVELLAQRVAELEAKNYFGRLFYIGPGLTESEQRELQPRFRAVCQSIRSFLNCRITPSDMPHLSSDIYWNSLRFTELLCEQCKNDDCSDRRIKNSVFCAWHHYCSIKGSPPES